MTLKTKARSLRSELEAVGIKGAIATPGDEGWDLARQAWNLAIDQRPAAVVFADNPRDVQSVVRVASHKGVKVVAQSSGHGASFFDSMEGAILIRMTRIRDLEITGHRARAGAGVLWGEVAMEAGPKGLAALHGSSPDVAVGGYILGGGIGWLGRKYGLATNSVTAVEMVTADGALRRIDTDNDPELFWAVRGGGGGFGITTHVEFDLFPVDRVFAGTLAWDASNGEAVFSAWAEWTKQLDEDTTSVVMFLNMPNIPDVPEIFAGRRVVTFASASIGPIGDAKKLIDEMRGVAPTILDTFDAIPAPELVRLHGDPEAPTPYLSHHTLLSDLSPDVATIAARQMGPESGNPLVTLEIRHLGGAMGRAASGGGVMSHVPAPYILDSVGLIMSPDDIAGTHERLTQTIDAFDEWKAGTYLNFSERPDDAPPFPKETLAELSRIKQSVDPNRMFLDRSLLAGLR